MASLCKTSNNESQGRPSPFKPYAISTFSITTLFSTGSRVYPIFLSCRSRNYCQRQGSGADDSSQLFLGTKQARFTDGRGLQHGYAEAVQLWCDFHDTLDNSNSNKFPKQLGGTSLRSQLFARTKDQVRVADKDGI